MIGSPIHQKANSLVRCVESVCCFPLPSSGAIILWRVLAFQRLTWRSKSYSKEVWEVKAVARRMRRDNGRCVILYHSILIAVLHIFFAFLLLIHLLLSAFDLSPSSKHKYMRSSLLILPLPISSPSPSNPSFSSTAPSRTGAAFIFSQTIAPTSHTSLEPAMQTLQDILTQETPTFLATMWAFYAPPAPSVIAIMTLAQLTSNLLNSFSAW